MIKRDIDATSLLSQYNGNVFNMQFEPPKKSNKQRKCVLNFKFIHQNINQFNNNDNALKQLVLKGRNSELTGNKSEKYKQLSRYYLPSSITQQRMQSDDTLNRTTIIFKILNKNRSTKCNNKRLISCSRPRSLLAVTNNDCRTRNYDSEKKKRVWKGSNIVKYDCMLANLNTQKEPFRVVKINPLSRAHVNEKSLTPIPATNIVKKPRVKKLPFLKSNHLSRRAVSNINSNSCNKLICDHMNIKHAVSLLENIDMNKNTATPSLISITVCARKAVI